MNTLFDRRKTNRIKLSKIENFFRQCDIYVSSEKGDIDITILDISPVGMRISINGSEDQSKISPQDKLFIRGCIFNDNIGFLSSQNVVAVWKENNICGFKFTPPLDLDELTIRSMIKHNQLQ
ncbi:pilus assembly protein PilZ [Maridesulfovibrio zosterae]|uniref:pilus assembly protein PilZ n=1 Tax=Maridesulfovibrio zosterae TaxID=82171 RepID=UPI0004055E9E|nr:pilus assembly protein PilZ [Maridesulfovibrio zosterae]